MPSELFLRSRVLALLLVLAPFVPAATRGALPEHPALSVDAPPAWAQLEELSIDSAPKIEIGDEVEGDGGVSRPEEAEADDEVRSVRFLLDDVQVRMARRGPAERFHRFAYRIESRTALEHWSSWQVDFSPENQNLVLHHLRVGRNGRWLDRLDRSYASLLQREAGLESQMYDDSRTLAVVLDDIRVGDVVDIAWSTRGSNPIFGGAYFDSFTLHGYRDVELLRVVIDHPVARPLEYRLLGDAPEPSVVRRTGRSRLAWEIRERPEIETETWVPAGTIQRPYLQVSEFPSWGDVVDWALPYYGLSEAPEDREALLRVVADLADAGSDDPRRRLAAVRQFVQDDVRYFAHLMGPHSHAPHAPSDTLRHRYGDCKDKTYLMIHLLAALGVEAWPVFVHSSQGRALPDRLPSPGVFDHAIVAAAMPDGPVFVDPTMRLQGGIEEMWVPDYGWGLEVRPGTTELTRIAPRPAATAATEVAYDYQVPAAGLVSRVTIESIYRGGRADRERDTWDGLDPSAMQDSYLGFYTSEQHKPTSAEPLTMNDDRQANEVRVVESYELEYVPTEDASTTFETLPLLFLQELPNVPWDPEGEAGAESGAEGDAVQDPVGGADRAVEAAQVGATADRGADTAEREPGRRHPIRLPHPLHLVETLAIHTEDALDWDVDEARIERPWLRFEVTAVTTEHDLFVRYELETLAHEVPAASIADYREVFDQIQGHTGFSIWTNWGDALSDGSAAIRALAVLTGALTLLTILSFASAITLRRRGIL